MESVLKEIMWKQFGAAIDMLENAIAICPDKLWDTNSKFWYKAYHTLFFLDYYLTEIPQGYSPPSPFTLSEFNPSGEMPARVYTKDELITFSRHCKQKCHDLIKRLTAEGATRRWVDTYRNYSVIELLLYNMRHVQHHAGQLNLLLRQGGIDAPDWVSRTKLDL